MGEMRDIYNYSKRLESARRRLAELEDSDLLLEFINHLEALGLSTGRVAKYANHVCALLRDVNFNPSKATRRDVERVAAWINAQSYKSSTKRGLRHMVRKLVQYAKHGSCDRKTPVPPEVAWLSMRADRKDLRLTLSPLKQGGSRMWLTNGAAAIGTITGTASGLAPQPRPDT